MLDIEYCEKAQVWFHLPPSVKYDYILLSVLVSSTSFLTLQPYKLPLIIADTQALSSSNLVGFIHSGSYV